ncbi:hypothetical protein VC83_06794 [Pseudogymnoascus destructans]|uniref:Uncharacterized protein n=1 Tax=Pseudogymnoascus destructans TaxID=655981 RepID=A0A177A4Y4_9PEZI|nr:uncharacterized protein VC83_06794 [Pseudogymnoascus destructans]OAF56301.1 hypothetical protein VC83_06794 [Pseudogymnoascus destructans]
MKWGARIRSARMTMEPHLRFRPLEDSALDPSSLILQRFYIEVLHQKTICVLHRRFIARARTNPRYAYSRRASVDAAMALLRIQATLHREAQPGGRISEVMWRLTALQKHDFVLGAMIVSLDLNHDRGGGSHTFWTAEQRADMLSSLETALAIWEGDQATSMEAYKGAKVLRIMVDKLKAQQSEVNQEVDEEMHPEHSATMTLGMLSSGGGGAAGVCGAESGEVGEGYGGPMEGVAGGSWAAWDKYVQMGSAVDPNPPYFPGVYDANALEMQMDPASGTGFGDGFFMGAHTPAVVLASSAVVVGAGALDEGRSGGGVDRGGKDGGEDSGGAEEDGGELHVAVGAWSLEIVVTTLSQSLITISRTVIIGTPQTCTPTTITVFHTTTYTRLHHTITSTIISLSQAPHSCYTATEVASIAYCPLFNSATCGPYPDCIVWRRRRCRVRMHVVRVRRR